MTTDNLRFSSFLDGNSVRQQIYEVLKAAGFEVSKVVEDNRRLWGFYLRPNGTIKELFGTPQEVLLWVAEYDSFQARTVLQAQEQLKRDPIRLCQDFVLIMVKEQTAHLMVSQVTEELPATYVGFSLAHLSRFLPYGHDNLILVLQQRLYSKDLYRKSTALTSASTFYGRKELVTEITQALKQDNSNIGVFGLRKCGKTSLLYRVLHQLKLSASVFVAHLDIQRIDSINPSTAYLLWSIGEAFLDINPQLRRLRDFRLFGKYALFSDAPTQSVVELFDHDIRYAISQTKSTNHRFVVMLDEFELMSPNTPGSRWGHSFVEVWRLLRGLHQQYAGRLAYFITGTNPRCVEANKINDIENPVYNYFDVKFLPPLASPACHQLLTELGLRMGLVWDTEASRNLIKLVGGHPFLLRAYASTVHRSLLPRDQRLVVTADVVSQQLDPFLMEFSPHLAQMADVLADEYENEYLILEHLAYGRLGEFRDLVKNFPEETAHLVGYGLISRDLNDSGLAIEVLQTWMQRRRRDKPVSCAGTTSGYKQGEDVCGYRIEASVGTAGGFARVYRAVRQDAGGTENDAVALKVLDNGSLKTLQREVDILSEVQHPNIVRFIDHGKAGDGRLFLVMEYLRGETFQHYCNRASRMSPAQVASSLRALTSALSVLHPDEALAEKLRRKSQLTEAEHATLLRARHGYVHRDIKPRNVILVAGRGPVLIDFNISTQVFSPVVTMSNTRGYLPPDGPRDKWTPDIDRYQLGLTMLQVSVGVDLELDGLGGTNIKDLRTMAEQELPKALSDVLIRMTNESLEWRFSSTSELQSVLNNLRI